MSGSGSLSPYVGMADYQEGLHTSPQSARPVLFGNRQMLSNEYKDLASLEAKSIHYGYLFFPERRQGGKERWDYKKNQAFWAGSIEAGKSFFLVTPITSYGNKMTGTISEILWLEDNGYRFVPDMKSDGTLVIPPNAPVPIAVIKDYSHLGLAAQNSALSRVKQIKAQVLAARVAPSAPAAAAAAPAGGGVGLPRAGVPGSQPAGLLGIGRAQPRPPVPSPTPTPVGQPVGGPGAPLPWAQVAIRGRRTPAPAPVPGGQPSGLVGIGRGLPPRGGQPKPSGPSAAPFSDRHDGGVRKYVQYVSDASYNPHTTFGRFSCILLAQRSL